MAATGQQLGLVVTPYIIFLVGIGFYTQFCLVPRVGILSLAFARALRRVFRAHRGIYMEELSHS